MVPIELCLPRIFVNVFFVVDLCAVGRCGILSWVDEAVAFCCVLICRVIVAFCLR